MPTERSSKIKARFIQGDFQHPGLGGRPSQWPASKWTDFLKFASVQGACLIYTSRTTPTIVLTFSTRLQLPESHDSGPFQFICCYCIHVPWDNMHPCNIDWILQERFLYIALSLLLNMAEDVSVEKRMMKCNLVVPLLFHRFFQRTSCFITNSFLLCIASPT